MSHWPSLSFSLTALVLALCLAMNLALIRQNHVFIRHVRSASGSKHILSPCFLGRPSVQLARATELIAFDLARRPPYPGELPIAVEPVVLETASDTHYGMDADEDWNSLFPGGFALDPITNATLLRIETISKVPSLYNQLYCLNRLRQIYMIPGWQDDKCKERQVHRCLNLVRQGLLCNGDTALDPTTTASGDGARPTVGTTGYGVKHVCRDWTKVREETERRLGSHRE